MMIKTNKIEKQWIFYEKNFIYVTVYQYYRACKGRLAI